MQRQINGDGAKLFESHSHVNIIAHMYDVCVCVYVPTSERDILFSRYKCVYIAFFERYDSVREIYGSKI